jgi:hypothetical protein
VTKFPLFPDFIAGVEFGIGAGLLIVAIADLNIIPEKKY